MTIYKNNVELRHYGIKGQKKGVRRWQNEDGSLTPEGKQRYYDGKTVFISGSSKTTTEDSGYYRKSLPKDVTDEIDKMITSGSKILVGDAPGIDSQVQDYLLSKKYNNVKIYGPGEGVRYKANKNWSDEVVDSGKYQKGTKEQRAEKDYKMSEDADIGFAVTLDEGSTATKNNLERLVGMGKDTVEYRLNKNGNDEWARYYDDSKLSDHFYELQELINMETNLNREKLSHSGIKGQKWGVRRFQNEDGTLTEEGKIRYGMKYSGLTDKQMRDAINYQRAKSTYTRMITKDASTKKEKLSGFISEGGGLISKAADTEKRIFSPGLNEKKTALEGEKNKYEQYLKRKDISDADRAQAEQQLENTKVSLDNTKAQIFKYENDAAIAGKVGELSGKGSLGGKIADFATKKERLELESKAAQNIAELDQDQLEKLVNRMKLEEEYEAMFNPPKKNYMDTGREALQLIGSVLGIGLTALEVINLIKKSRDTAAHTDSTYTMLYSYDALMHYGIKGQKHGVRRWQNEDGSLTPAGYDHYGIEKERESRKIEIEKQRTRDALAMQKMKGEYSRSRVASRESTKLSNYGRKVERQYDLADSAYARTQARKDAVNDLKLQRQQFKIDQKMRKEAAKQDRKQQLEQAKQDLSVKKANQKATRENIFKYAIGAVALAGTAYAGYSFIHNINLDKAHMRNLETIAANGKQVMDQMKLSKDKEIELAKISKDQELDKQRLINSGKEIESRSKDIEAQGKEAEARSKLITAQMAKDKQDEDFRVKWNKEAEDAAKEKAEREAKEAAERAKKAAEEQAKKESDAAVAKAKKIAEEQQRDEKQQSRKIEKLRKREEEGTRIFEKAFSNDDLNLSMFTEKERNVINSPSYADMLADEMEKTSITQNSNYSNQSFLGASDIERLLSDKNVSQSMKDILKKVKFKS